MAAETDDHGRVKVDTGNGSALYALPFDSEVHANAIESELATKTETPTDSSTPDPTGEQEDRDRRDGGPTRRINDVVTDLGSVGLESLALDNLEVAKAIAKRSDEIYRNEFPIFTPRFQVKCEHCGAEFDDRDAEECDECGATDADDPGLRSIDMGERRELEAFAESVNKEGQSLRELMQMAEDDQSRLGVSTLVCKFDYAIAGRTVSANGRTLAEAGEVIAREFDELVRGDAKRIVPVVDEHGRIGGFWWTCPVHREAAVATESGVCETCGAELREVYYAELERAGARRRQNDVQSFYFEEEVVMWAHHIPRLHGLDGVSPVHLVWVQQAILHWMNTYAVEYFDPHSDRTPNKFLMVHTTNPDAFEKQLDEAEEDQKQDPYTSSIFYNEYSPESNSTPDVEVVDTMGDEFLGQSHDLRKKFESQIRNTFGITDAQDSEMEDAGGLNNEGLQLEVTDRSVASAQQKLADGPLDRLLSILGYDDWLARYVPPQETKLDDLEQSLDIARKAEEVGVGARIEDGEVKVNDGEAELQDQGAWEEPSVGGVAPGQQGPPSPETPGEPRQSAEGSPTGAVAETAVTDGGVDQHLRDMEGAFKHIVWPDPGAESLDELGQKASSSYWNSASDVPKYVRSTIEDAINSGVVWAGVDIDASTLDISRFFRSTLDDASGWSLATLADDFAERFDTSIDKALEVVRSEAAAILNKAREIGLKRSGRADEQLYMWQGPQDGHTTQCCTEIKAASNPEHGGEPMPLDELKSLVREKSREHFPDMDTREWVAHIQERHTYVRAG